MKPIYKQIKEELKELASKIRPSKQTLKDLHRANPKDMQLIWKEIRTLYTIKKEYRHRHIARCLLRGRSYDQIEIPAEDNKPNGDLVNKYIKEYKERILESLKIEASTYETICAN